MSDIYDQHQAAFSQVSAYVIMKNGEKVATVALKFPRDGAGRLWAYVHWIGTEMVRGYAGGYGYDKRSAAVASAARKMANGDQHENRLTDWLNFRDAIAADRGQTWDSALRDAGFTVLQAV